MSTPSPRRASGVPRQLTVLLPPKIYSIFPTQIRYASSATHVAVASEICVCIYSLPAFDLVDMIQPGKLETFSLEPLQIHGRILVIRCYPEGFEAGPFLYIWDISARRHIGNVMCTFGDHNQPFSVSFPSAEIADEGKLDGTTQDWRQDPLLIYASQSEDGIVADLKAYMLCHSDASIVQEGGIKGTQRPWVMAPAMAIFPIHRVNCLASTGRTALTGGRDGTVRTWDITTGNCELVLIGHTGAVAQVCIAEERIYSTSYDCTIRIWDRHKGDCFRVLEIPIAFDRFGWHKMFVSLPHLIITSHNLKPTRTYNDSTALVWDIVSGELEHRIKHHLQCNLGRIRGKERTLATLEVDEYARIYWCRIWELRPGRPLMNLSVETGFLMDEFFCQGRFFMGMTYQDEERVLKVWDFGANDSLNAEVGSKDRRSSRDDETDKTEAARKDDNGKIMAPSPSGSVVAGMELASDSKVDGQQKGGKAKSFIRHLFRRG